MAWHPRPQLRSLAAKGMIMQHKTRLQASQTTTKFQQEAVHISCHASQVQAATKHPDFFPGSCRAYRPMLLCVRALPSPGQACAGPAGWQALCAYLSHRPAFSSCGGYGKVICVLLLMKFGHFIWLQGGLKNSLIKRFVGTLSKLHLGEIQRYSFGILGLAIWTPQESKVLCKGRGRDY